MARSSSFLTFLLVCVAQAPAQAPARSVLGTVLSVQTDTAELQVKPDSGEVRVVKLSPDTVYQRIAPGEKDLRAAQPMALTGIRSADRVLISLLPDGTTARRVVVMAVEDISKRNQRDQEDWERRGVSGVVTARSGSTITLRVGTIAGAGESVVIVNEKTSIRRYAADSVKFADVEPSTLAAIQTGDQLRARGTKAENGLNVIAEEVVFGTFVTKAGTIMSVNAEANEIVIADLNTKKTVTVKMTPDSQLKRMPGGPPAAGMPGPGGRGGPGAGGARPGGPPDLSRMLERMPATKLAELKPGETIVVSSTKGARPNEVTAIVVLANAEMLIQMARARAAGAREQTGQGNNGPSMAGPQMGPGGGLGGFDLSGIAP